MNTFRGWRQTERESDARDRQRKLKKVKGAETVLTSKLRISAEVIKATMLLFTLRV